MQRFNTAAVWMVVVIFCLAPGEATAGEPIKKRRDVSFFLKRMRRVDHLPELNASRTAMWSTWDQSGGNRDGDCFKQIEVEWDPSQPALMEGEDMGIVKAEGVVGCQRMEGFGKEWRGNRILWWREARPGARLVLDFPAPGDGSFRVAARFTKAPDYGIHCLKLNGRSGGEVDLYHPQVKATGLMDLGLFDLMPSGNRLEVEAKGAHPEAMKAYMFGLDCLVFVPKGQTIPSLDSIPPPRRASNVLLDVDGPGCVHRLFCGWGGMKERTRIQVILDHGEKPLLDLPIPEFFDYEKGPFPYPLVFHKSYPGLLFPIPYKKHCRIQLIHPDYGTPEWDRGAWSNYWQVTFTTYPPDTPVMSLTWPLTDSESQEALRTCEAWLAAESAPVKSPESWTVDQTFVLEPHEECEVPLHGTGVIRQLQVTVDSPSAELLRELRFRMHWNGAEYASVDVPVGFFFGHAYCGGGLETRSMAAAMDKPFIFEHRPDPRPVYSSDYHSLLLSVQGTKATACFPMPFEEGAVIRFVNHSEKRVDGLTVRADVASRSRLPREWGFFHATWSEERAATPAVPRFGPQQVPGKVVLDRRCRGKYVGVMLQVEWPHPVFWWGEGDWLIWADRDDWPPAYHGTGSEEYFNSGWCRFDRKAISGFVALRPGHPTVYSFHLNDAFQFQESIRVVEEQMGCEPEAVKEIQTQHPIWGSTAFWYGLEPLPAESRITPLKR